MARKGSQAPIAGAGLHCRPATILKQKPRKTMVLSPTHHAPAQHQDSAHVVSPPPSPNEGYLGTEVSSSSAPWLGAPKHRTQ